MAKAKNILTDKKAPWVLASVTTWLAVAGIIGGIAVYIWTAVDDHQIKQAYQLRTQLDSLDDRGYLLQHKIDSLNRLGVANIDYLEDTTATLTK